MYGQRAVVTLPATGNSVTACGMLRVGPAGVALGSAGVHDRRPRTHAGGVTDATRGGRWYDGVAALPRTTATSSPPPTAPTNVAAGNAAWVQRFSATGGVNGVGLADATFNPTGAGMVTPVAGRVVVQNGNLHAIRLLGTDVVAAGESLDAVATNRRMLVARISTAGAMVGGFGANGVALARVAGGNNTGQAFVFQGPNVIVGGSANLAGRAALGLARLNATTGVARSHVRRRRRQRTGRDADRHAGRQRLHHRHGPVHGNLLAVSGRASRSGGPGDGRCALLRRRASRRRRRRSRRQRRTASTRSPRARPASAARSTPTAPLAIGGSSTARRPRTARRRRRSRSRR